MSIVPDNARRDAHHLYRAMREFLESMDDTLPGKFEITKEGIVHDMMAPVGPHELTTLHLRRRLEKVMPEELVAHTGTPDVEAESEGIMRHPDVMVIAMADMDVPGSIDGRTLIAAIAVVSTRKDFLYGEDVTIAGWTISTAGLPRYGETPTDSTASAPSS
ncbi:Uma2 family endonuclease [Streptomyces sp. NPDC127574]|uniref:Uma2 family endonuclease n=1 Tax=Streptomyces sp. NPDC127574 TaxID=3345401 RepID=UPI0036260C75